MLEDNRNLWLWSILDNGEKVSVHEFANSAEISSPCNDQIICWNNGCIFQSEWCVGVPHLIQRMIDGVWVETNNDRVE